MKESYTREEVLFMLSEMQRGLYSREQVVKICSKAITRSIYDVIATFESHERDHIPVDWLRDYADDVGINFSKEHFEDER